MCKERKVARGMGVTGIEAVNSVVWIGITNKVSSARRVQGGEGGSHSVSAG